MVDFEPHFDDEERFHEDMRRSQEEQERNNDEFRRQMAESSEVFERDQQRLWDDFNNAPPMKLPEIKPPAESEDIYANVDRLLAENKELLKQMGIDPEKKPEAEPRKPAALEAAKKEPGKFADRSARTGRSLDGSK